MTRPPKAIATPIRHLIAVFIRLRSELYISIRIAKIVSWPSVRLGCSLTGQAKRLASSLQHPSMGVSVHFIPGSVKVQFDSIQENNAAY